MSKKRGKTFTLTWKQDRRFLAGGYFKGSPALPVGAIIHEVEFVREGASTDAVPEVICRVVSAD